MTKFAAIFIFALITIAPAAPVRLTWDGHQPGQRYRVLRGIDVLAECEGPSAWLDLPTDKKTVVCIQAVKDGATEMSEPVTLLPVTAMETDNLGDWTVRRVFFTVEKPAGFFRFSYPKD